MVQSGPMPGQSKTGAGGAKLALVIARMTLKIALVVGGLMTATGWLGVMLDRALNTRPWISVGLLLLMSIPAMIIAYRIGLSAVREHGQQPVAAHRLKESEQA